MSILAAIGKVAAVLLLVDFAFMLGLYYGRRLSSNQPNPNRRHAPWHQPDSIAASR